MSCPLTCRRSDAEFTRRVLSHLLNVASDEMADRLETYRERTVVGENR